MSVFFRRPCSGFFSYSHADRLIAQPLVAWLKDWAGLEVWFDEHDLAGGQPVRGSLQEAIRGCRAFFLLLSPSSVSSRWVFQEWETANEELAQEPLFRIVVIATQDLPERDVPKQLRTTTYLRIGADGMDRDVAAQLLSSLYEADPLPGATRDLYVTRSWRRGRAESGFADDACRMLAEAGFRLIGDVPRDDQDLDRIRSIMASCGAYLALVPPREPAELRFLLPEVILAEECGLPSIVIADPAVATSSSPLVTVDGRAVDLSSARRMDMEGASPAEVRSLVDGLAEHLNEAYRRPSDPYEVVVSAAAGNLEAGSRIAIERVIRGITGRGCVFSHRISGDEVSRRLTSALRDAVAVIADVSDPRALEVWVQAALARGAGRRVCLLTREREPWVPLVFNDDKPVFYTSDVERLGIIHRLVFDHRRRIMNREVTVWH